MMSMTAMGGSDGATRKQEDQHRDAEPADEPQRDAAAANADEDGPEDQEELNPEHRRHTRGPPNEASHEERRGATRRSTQGPG
jgi:hypothetical protein